MAITITKLEEDQLGGRIKAWVCNILLDNSYPTGGYAISPSKIGLKTIWGFNILGVNAAGSGIVSVVWDYVNNKLMAFRVATFTPAGTVAAPTFTGTAPTSDLELATPAFTGTGLTAAGQVITTTDNQTMTLNQCAGMWLISATGATPPNLILSNTAVVGAPAVLTVQGSANTDAGAYKIVKGVTPAGSNSAPAFTGTAQGQVALAQVSNAVNLSAVTVRAIVMGRP
jgi:hypothetical protein